MLLIDRVSSQVHEDIRRAHVKRIVTSAGIAAFAFVLGRWYEPRLAMPTPVSTADAAPTPHVAAVGTALFTEFALPFEVVSLVLLVAIVGAVVVARRKTAP